MPACLPGGLLIGGPVGFLAALLIAEPALLLVTLLTVRIVRLIGQIFLEGGAEGPAVFTLLQFSSS
jgi:hypothetical protein